MVIEIPDLDFEKFEKPDMEKPDFGFDDEKPDDSDRMPRGQLDFEDQFLSEDSSVIVEDVSSARSSALVVTYEEDGELIIAGLEEVGELDSEDVEVTIEDAGTFPGEHAAHLVPTDRLSSDYEVGGSVSEQTAENIIDSEAAEVS